MDANHTSENYKKFGFNIYSGTIEFFVPMNMGYDFVDVDKKPQLFWNVFLQLILFSF
jgi:hypothetical protein